MAKSFKNIFEQTFYAVDNSFVQEFEARSKKCGSTAVCVVIIGDRLYCANVGDSRAIISSEGTAIELSWDHNLAREDEKRRVEENGGLEVGKVHGALSVTRAFGNSNYKFTNEFKYLDYKTLLVTPEVREHYIDPFKDEFIVVASDGLFEEMQSQNVVNFIRERYDNPPEVITQELLSEVLDVRDKVDDITIILIKLQRHLRYSEMLYS